MTHKEAQTKILLVEDDDATRFGLTLLGPHNNWTITEAETGEKGLEIARGNQFDVILLDLGLPGMNGIEFIKSLRDQGITTPIIVISGYSDADIKVEALNAGADDYLVKPFAFKELVDRVVAVVRRSRWSAEMVVLEDDPLSIFAGGRTRRWTINRKRRVAEAIRSQQLTIEAATAIYEIDLCEIARWLSGEVRTTRRRGGGKRNRTRKRKRPT